MRRISIIISCLALVLAGTALAASNKKVTKKVYKGTSSQVCRNGKPCPVGITVKNHKVTYLNFQVVQTCTTGSLPMTVRTSVSYKISKKGNFSGTPNFRVQISGHVTASKITGKIKTVQRPPCFATSASYTAKKK